MPLVTDSFSTFQDQLSTDRPSALANRISEADYKTVIDYVKALKDPFTSSEKIQNIRYKHNENLPRTLHLYCEYNKDNAKTPYTYTLILETKKKQPTETLKNSKGAFKHGLPSFDISDSSKPPVTMISLVLKGEDKKKITDKATIEYKYTDSIPSHRNILHPKLSQPYSANNMWKYTFHSEHANFDGTGIPSTMLAKNTSFYSKIKNCFYQFLEGLAFLHKHELIHRDIKPANLIFFYDSGSKTLTLKIIDFANACFKNENLLPLATRGFESPQMYALFKELSEKSPEKPYPKKIFSYFDNSSDYSLGKVLANQVENPTAIMHACDEDDMWAAGISIAKMENINLSTLKGLPHDHPAAPLLKLEPNQRSLTLAMDNYNQNPRKQLNDLSISASLLQPKGKKLRESPTPK